MKKITGILLLSLFFLSCKKDQEDFQKLKDGDFTVVNWEPTYVVPLVNTETTLGQIYSELDTLIQRLDDDNNLTISIDENNLFVLSYDASLETGDINDYYNLNDVDETFLLTIPPSVIASLSALPVGQTFSGIWDTTFTFDLTPPEAALLEEVLLDGGDITFEHEGTDINQNLDVDITIKSIVNRTSGDTVRLEADYSPVGINTPGMETFSDHRADFRDESLVGNDQFNKFQVNVKVGGQIINPTLSGSQIELRATATNFNLCFVQGFLGKFSTKIDSGTVTFNIFDGENLDGIHFRDPKVIFDFESTAGLPMTAEILGLSLGYADGSAATLGVDGETTTNSGITSLSDIPNNPALNQYVVDNTSQLDELLFTSPNKLIYDIQARSTEETSSGVFRFFLDKRSKIKMNVLAELPVDFSVDNYEYRDTTDVDGVGIKMDLDKDSTNTDYFKRAALKLIFNNQLPLETEVQGYLLDSNGVLLDSIFDNGFKTVLANSNVDGNGVSGNAQDIITVVDIDQAKFENFLTTSQIVYAIRASTSNSTSNSFGDVKILSNYIFGLRVGLLAELDVDLNKELELPNN